VHWRRDLWRRFNHRFWRRWGCELISHRLGRGLIGCIVCHGFAKDDIQSEHGNQKDCGEYRVKKTLIEAGDRREWAAPTLHGRDGGFENFFLASEVVEIIEIDTGMGGTARLGSRHRWRCFGSGLLGLGSPDNGGAVRANTRNPLEFDRLSTTWTPQCGHCHL
jgi:hypothetical protein